MKKLRLDLDNLEVESFDTTPGARGDEGGTVFGQNHCTCQTQCTCPGCPTCDATCPDTCAYTCDGFGCGSYTCDPHLCFTGDTDCCY